MGIDLERLIRLRPYVYHLTARTNLGLLRISRRLFSATRLLVDANEAHLIREVRRDALCVKRDGAFVEICDQQPLAPGNIEFQDGCGFEDLLETLSSRVYFWPGNELRPIAHGLRHFERYRSRQPAIFRVELAELLAANPAAIPELCAYNSGAPRCSGGKKSPRGRKTFVQPALFPRRPSDVVEVTFTDEVRLPAGTEVSSSPEGPWHSF